MSRRPAKFTQADVARAIRAAKQADAAGIEVQPDGSIRILLSPVSTGYNHVESPPLAEKKVIVL